MNLSFKQRVNGDPTFFIQKIWDGLISKEICSYRQFVEFNNRHRDKFGIPFSGFDHWVFSFSSSSPTSLPKLHTIRHPRKGQRQWRVGDKIHFSINPRQKSYFQFAPVVQVKSIQEISIDYSQAFHGYPVVWVDHVALKPYDLMKLAEYDGLKNVDHFFKWFNESFEGYIIHWTDKMY